MDGFKLNTHASLAKAEGPVLVCILDGYGENEYKDEFNAVVQVVDQGARLVDIALEDGTLFTSDGWKVIEPAFAGNTLHMIGLCSDGGVHSRLDQVYKIIDGALERGVKRLRVHALADGRDVQDGSSVKYFGQMRDFLAKVSADKGVDACIASGGGRMHVTMDRYEADWSIVQRGYYAHVLGEAPNTFVDVVDGIKQLRAKSGNPEKPISDQFLEAFVIVDDAGKPVGAVKDGDAVVIFNYRADRVVELSKALEYEDFTYFDRKRWPKMRFSGIMQYDGDLKLPKNFIVPPPVIDKVSGQYLTGSSIRTFAISETQKFGHVTFFWNGNRSGFFNADLETFLEIPSDKVVFNEKPEMKAREICDAAKEALLSGKFDMVRVNFANPDMVGHTGDLKATTYACEVVDKCLQELLDTVDSVKGRWLVTSDHGNADDMVQRTKTGAPIFDEGRPVPLTSHTLAPVGVSIGGAGLPESVQMRADLLKAGLANITATYINLLGLETPPSYEPSLLQV